MKKISFITLCHILIVIMIFSNASAKSIYVDTSGDTDPNGSTLDPFPTIQQAVDIAVSGDVIILHPGIYTGTGNYNIDPEGLILTIQSLEPENPAFARTTIIDPNGHGRAFIFHSGEDPNFLITGLTIRKGSASGPPFGSAVYCVNSSPMITYCTFSDCFAGGLGGAIYFSNSLSYLQNCLFGGNLADGGGALMIDSNSEITIQNCTFAGNSADFYGGAISCRSYGHVQIKDSIIWRNILNYPAEEEQKYQQIEVVDNSSISMLYSNLQGGINGIYTNSGTGEILHYSYNTDNDPNFSAFSESMSGSEMDLHLMSRYGRWDTVSGSWVNDFVTSPCIDNADPNESCPDEPWPNGKKINMGGYGKTIEASKNGNIADFNIDNSTDILDLAYLLSSWLSAPTDYEDLDSNGTVDMVDYRLLSNEWLWERF